MCVQERLERLLLWKIHPILLEGVETTSMKTFNKAGGRRKSGANCPIIPTNPTLRGVKRVHPISIVVIIQQDPRLRAVLLLSLLGYAMFHRQKDRAIQLRLGLPFHRSLLIPRQPYSFCVHILEGFADFLTPLQDLRQQI